ncbi:hypothetical protein OUZ56_029993 [Daphnia magna]|uniref:Uncharacterized protein n=1 Tax=Daphnia magna TaxID=35525 RepID=A0ABR0B8I1_9CRUS|nr:hypothetical protein OUZ56_029993 [Daphnia magna]
METEYQAQTKLLNRRRPRRQTAERARQLQAPDTGRWSPENAPPPLPPPFAPSCNPTAAAIGWRPHAVT